MQLFANNKLRLLLQILSIILVALIRNSYGHAAISVYNRYPVLVIALCAILLFGVLTQTKFSLFCEIVGYISLLNLLIVRLTTEMEGFVTLNSHLYGVTEYVKLIIGVILFLILLVYYAKRTYSFFMHK